MVSRSFDALHRFHLPRSQLTIYAFAKQIDKSDDCVERSSKLVRNVRKELTLHAIDAQQLGGEPLELLRALHETAGLTALVAYYESETKYGCEGYDPPDAVGPVIEANVRKRLH